MRSASSQVKMSGSEKIIKVNMNTGNKIFGKHWLNLYIREYNSGSNRASNFKSAERVARGRFEITSPITPELYSTQSYY